MQRITQTIVRNKIKIANERNNLGDGVGSLVLMGANGRWTVGQYVGKSATAELFTGTLRQCEIFLTGLLAVRTISRNAERYATR